MSLAVRYHDNRGDDEYPYGFVYFNDDTRVGYTSDAGVFPTQPGLYKATDDPAHLEMARAYLREHGVPGNYY